MRKFEKSFEMYDYNLLYVRWLADVCGVDMMVENYKMNYRTAGTIFAITFTLISSFYSCYFYYPDWYSILDCLIAFSICLQGAIKFYNGYIHRHFFMIMYGRLRNLHYKYRFHRNNAPLLLLIERIHLISKYIFVIFCVGGLSYVLHPVYMYWTEHRRELLFAVRLPGVDADSFNGYVITLCSQITLVVISVFGLTASDSAILLFVCSLAGFVEVFKNELDELNTLLNDEKRDDRVIQRKVREICVQHFAIIEYESDLDERYISTCFIQVISATIGISVSLFLVYMVGYIRAYVLLLVLFSQLLEFCLLGTVLTVKNEEITEAIYGINWHVMKKPEQKCFALMLHKSQNFVEMTVGGLAPLNIETFVRIVKSIYSYFMMLISFVE